MEIEHCPSFEKCEAPLCPLYEFNKDSVWYADEPICNTRGKPRWVKKQRRITKKTKDRDSYYTIEMLEAIHAVTKSTKGLDAEGKRSEDVFLKRRSKGRATNAMPEFGQKTAVLTSGEKHNPQNIGKEPYQPKLIK